MRGEILEPHGRGCSWLGEQAGPSCRVTVPWGCGSGAGQQRSPWQCLSGHHWSQERETLEGMCEKGAIAATQRLRTVPSDLLRRTRTSFFLRLKNFVTLSFPMHIVSVFSDFSVVPKNKITTKSYSCALLGND